MASGRSARPPSKRTLWIYLLGWILVAAAGFVIDNALVMLAGAVLSLFGVGYFMRYYMRTGRNVIEDSFKSSR